MILVRVRLASAHTAVQVDGSPGPEIGAWVSRIAVERDQTGVERAEKNARTARRSLGERRIDPGRDAAHGDLVAGQGRAIEMRVECPTLDDAFGVERHHACRW